MSEPGRVVVITTSLAAGGAEKQAVLIANGLARSQPVSLVTLTDADFLVDRVSKDVNYVCLDMSNVGAFTRNPKELRRCVRILKDLGPESVISLNFPAQFLVFASQNLGLLVNHVISERQESLGGRARVLLRHAMYRKASKITANTRATAEAIRVAHLASASDVVIVPNIVEAANLASLVSASGRFNWIAIGRLDRQKDFESLLRAMKIVSLAMPDVKLTIVGRGGEQAALSKLADHLGLTTVEFLGERTDAMELLSASDALVLSSRWEGVPNVVLEAGVRGVPVVATDVGGVRDALPSESYGFLVRPGEPAELAESMMRLMAYTQTQRRQLGSAAARHMKVNFSEAMSIALWQRVLNSNRR